MAVRTDASGESLSRTTNLPPVTAYTVMGRFRVSVDRNALSSFFAIGLATSSAYVQATTDSDGTTLIMYVGDSSVTGPALTVGQTYHIAITCSGTTLRLFLDGVFQGQSSRAAGVTANNVMYVCNSPDGEWLNGNADNVLVYSAALSDAEVAIAARTRRPIRLANLNAWYPMLPGGSRALDFSGNNNHLTAAGTLADEDIAPLPWGGKLPAAPFFSAGGTLYSLTLSGAIGPAGAVVRSAARSVSGSIGSAGAAARTPTKALAGSTGSAGAITRSVTRLLSGALAPAGAAARTLSRALAGSIGSAGALVRTPTKALAGSISSAGAITRSVTRLLSGALGSSGDAAITRVIIQAFSGAVSSNGAVASSVTRLLSGAVSSAGAITRSVARLLSGAVAPAGAAARTLSRALAGALGSSGDAAPTKLALLALEGSLASLGAASRAVARSLEGGLALAGSVARGLARVLSGAISSAGAVVASLVQPVRTAKAIIYGLARLAGIGGPDRTGEVDGADNSGEVRS